MLGKHFALVGSTGTGKSTAAAMILHRVCETAAAWPHRHDRPARRIWRGVQGQWRALRRRQPPDA
ncbi:helicase HerA domain-containing protein [Sphingomonas sp. MMS24-JH45]